MDAYYSENVEKNTFIYKDQKIINNILATKIKWKVKIKLNN
jgi:hypothetical protein